jgi:hypothetical protein
LVLENLALRQQLLAAVDFFTVPHARRINTRPTPFDSVGRNIGQVRPGAVLANVKYLKGGNGNNHGGASLLH